MGEDEKKFISRNYQAQNISELKNWGKKGKIVYDIDPYTYMYIPYCSMCREFAYVNEYCVFCGCDLEQPSEEEKKKAKEINKEYTSVYKNIRVQQYSNSIWTFKDGQLLSHSTMAKPLSQEELDEYAKNYYHNINNPNKPNKVVKRISSKRIKKISKELSELFGDEYAKEFMEKIHFKKGDK